MNPEKREWEKLSKESQKWALGAWKGQGNDITVRKFRYDLRVSWSSSISNIRAPTLLTVAPFFCLHCLSKDTRLSREENFTGVDVTSHQSTDCLDRRQSTSGIPKRWRGTIGLVVVVIVGRGLIIFDRDASQTARNLQVYWLPFKTHHKRQPLCNSKQINDGRRRKQLVRSKQMRSRPVAKQRPDVFSCQPVSFEAITVLLQSLRPITFSSRDQTQSERNDCFSADDLRASKIPECRRWHGASGQMPKKRDSATHRGTGNTVSIPADQPQSCQITKTKNEPLIPNAPQEVLLMSVEHLILKILLCSFLSSPISPHDD